MIDKKKYCEKLLPLVQEATFIEHTACSISNAFGKFMMVASKGHGGFPFKSFSVYDTDVDEMLINYCDDQHVDLLVDQAYANMVTKAELSLKELCSYLDKKVGK